MISDEDTKTASTTALSNLHLSNEEKTKLVPYTVTGVPPDFGPDEGDKSEIESAGKEINETDPPKYVTPPLNDTERGRVAGSKPAGDAHVSFDDETKRAGEVTPSKEQRIEEDAKKLLPVIVTVVPPLSGPEEGKMEYSNGSTK
jgi:hypothetical protein